MLCGESLVLLISLGFTVRQIRCRNKPVSHLSVPLLCMACCLPASSCEQGKLAVGGDSTDLVFCFVFLFQGVHESKGVTEDYLKLESLIQKVVSPYLGTYGLYSSDGPFTHSSCILGKNNSGLI